tara:strand:- start:392 stop:622 length:231 start_codon:yes stop_codon:yes gene_type:complete
MADTVWKTAKETAHMLGVSQQRVCKLAREGRFGTMAYKKYAKELNFNGAWMIGFPNEYKRKPVGQPSKNKQKPYTI